MNNFANGSTWIPLASNSRCSDTNWPEWWFMSKGKSILCLFYEVVCQVMRCRVACSVFSNVSRGVAPILSVNCGKESGHLDLRKVVTMHISMDIGSELSETCSQFAWGPCQIWSKFTSEHLWWVSHLWLKQTIALVKHCSWSVVGNFFQNKIYCWHLHFFAMSFWWGWETKKTIPKDNNVYKCKSSAMRSYRKTFQSNIFCMVLSLIREKMSLDHNLEAHCHKKKTVLCDSLCNWR